MDGEIRIEPLSITFEQEKENRTVRIPKSQTKIQNIEQFNLITYDSNLFVPMQVIEEDDAYLFTFIMDRKWKKWSQMKQLGENEKLRALSNVQSLLSIMSTRVTFFLHPNNLVFDHNLMPRIVFRGIRGLTEPFEINEADILKQYQCLVVSMFSEAFTFDDMYKGALEKAASDEFAQLVIKQASLEELWQVLQDSFEEKQLKTENEKVLVSMNKFKWYKHLSIWISVLAVLFLALLMYSSFIKLPYQEKLLDASHAYLEKDYDDVIDTLHDEDPDDLPQATKYILASSYLKVEPLTDEEKDSIMKNIDLNSDKRYLLYWIYNGKGDFDQSLDTAKYIDDPTLIMYGLIKNIEQVKNDPDIAGDDRDEQVGKLRDELEKYVEDYDIELEPEKDSDYMDYPEEKAADEDSEATENEDKTPKSVNDKKKDKDKEKKKDK